MATLTRQWLQQHIEDEMRYWHVPGCAIAVVNPHKTLFADGFGYRDIETQQPVTPKTLFGVASTTKAFAAAAIGVLVDEGKLSWDTPVQTVIPELALWDDVATTRITPRDLLCHRSGLPRHDAVWYTSPLSREALVKRLKHLEPTADFRAKWQYQNLMYVLAGYLVERITGESWETFVQQHIFAPLGMSRSNFSIHAMQKDANHALPYEHRSNKVNRIPFADVDAISPAGGINACVTEMAQWLRLQLNNGTHSGEQIITQQTMTHMHTPQMIVDDPDRNALLEEDFITYGLGWFVHSYRGHKLIYHGGAIDGYASRVAFMPELGIGTIIYTNLDENPLPGIITYKIFDHLLDLPPRDWRGKTQQLRDKDLQEVQAKLTESAAKQVKNTTPSHPLTAFVGDYNHPAYNLLRVEQTESGSLRCIYNKRVWQMHHYHYDIFEAVLEYPTEKRLKMHFHMNTDGAIASVAIPMQDGVRDIIFTHR